MKTVYLTHHSEAVFEDAEPCVLAMGFFDGVHIGHRKVIKAAKQIALEQKVKSAVMTFYPHPKEVISNGNESVDYIISLARKEELISQLGIDILYVINFDMEFAKLPPKEFVRQYMLRVQAIHVVAGFDFTYGYCGKGNMNTLGQDGLGRFGVTVVPKISLFDKKISSTYMRELLIAGEVSKIPTLLGDYHETFGEITSFQMMNNRENKIEISSHERFMLPVCGAYDVVWKVDELEHYGISLLTTKKRGAKHLEIVTAHANKDMIGKCVKIRWIKQRKFFFSPNQKEYDPPLLRY
ncbi:FAD synthetase family protein [Bacillus sp. JJ1764]|uniref:FAD synthetase family protein n=1 Tax=Bacillus sp. JJ1764 TaxID=3122964 RepID=UPI00300011DF